jgi:hypothetical protein
MATKPKPNKTVDKKTTNKTNTSKKVQKAVKEDKKVNAVLAVVNEKKAAKKEVKPELVEVNKEPIKLVTTKDMFAIAYTRMGNLLR